MVEACREGGEGVQAGDACVAEDERVAEDKVGEGRTGDSSLIWRGDELGEEREEEGESLEQKTHREQEERGFTPGLLRVCGGTLT